MWARQIGTLQWDVGSALCADGLGGVFFAGLTSGIMAGTTPGRVWIARYDALGVQRTIMQFGSGFLPGLRAICRDGLGGAFVAGSTTGSFGGPSAGGNDAWVAHIRGGTSVGWIHQFGSSAYDESTALAFAGPGRVFAAGTTYGNFAPGGGGFDDAWLALYETCVPDCDADGSLTLADFACFQAKFVAADPYADCNADGSFTIADFGCFQTRWVQGCP